MPAITRSRYARAVSGPHALRHRMTPPARKAPRAEVDPQDASRLRLQGRWTLYRAEGVGAALRGAPDTISVVDARGVERLDSLGVLQLLRFADRRKLDFSAFGFAEEHHALVAAIEDVHDDRPKRRREYGFAAALARLGYAIHDNGKEVVALVSFLGEALVKLLRTILQPRRLRLTSTVHHMEQVGLDAVPLVTLLSFLVGAVIA